MELIQIRSLHVGRLLYKRKRRAYDFIQVHYSLMAERVHPDLSESGGTIRIDKMLQIYSGVNQIERFRPNYL